MGPILLDVIGIHDGEFSMIDWGGALSPPLGGPVQHLMRLGTRHSFTFTPPSMESEPKGRICSARLRMAKLYGALYPFLQDGFPADVSAGHPVAATDGQTGMTLALASFFPGYVVREGQAFSLIHNGKRYLYFASAETIVAHDGTVSLPIFPMLRTIVSAGDVCEFDRPMIQGSLSGNELKWKVQTAPFTDLGAITITEDE